MHFNDHYYHICGFSIYEQQACNQDFAKKTCVVRRKAFFLNQKLKFFCLKRVRKRWPGSNFCLFFEEIATMTAIAMPIKSNFARV